MARGVPLASPDYEVGWQGGMVKTWKGFKSAEALMDKLMDIADNPPIDVMADLPPAGTGELSPLRRGRDEEAAELDAAM